MGLTYANILLSNPGKDHLKPIQVNALVDTGAVHLCVPEQVALQLELKENYKREVTTADGKVHLCSYVGPVHIKFENRGCFTGALVIGDEVLMGAVPMEDMDLLIAPAKQQVVVNPQSPNIPSAFVK